MKTLYESILDDFDVFSSRADSVVFDDMVKQMENELKAIRNIRPKTSLQVKDGILYVSEDILINDQTYEILNKYKSVLKITSLVVDNELTIQREDISELFKDITCDRICLSVVSKVEGLNIHITDKHYNEVAIEIEYGYEPYFKNCNIIVDGKERLIRSDSMVEFFKCEVKGIQSIRIYSASLFERSGGFAWGRVLDASQTMKVYKYGSESTVNKKCTMRNLRAIIVGTLSKYEPYPPGDVKYIKFKPGAKMEDVIDVSGFVGLESIWMRDNGITVECIPTSSKRGQDLINYNNKFVSRPFIHQFPDGGWVVNMISKR